MTAAALRRDGEEAKAIALYLHIPFCKQKCAYCDFASYAGHEDAMARYCDALMCEMKRAAVRCGQRVVHSVFFGGGTPTLLTGTQITQLLECA